MDSNAEHHRPVRTEQVEEDFVASALLALKQGPSVVTLASSSSWTSLNSSGTIKEHTKEATTQEPSLPLQSSTGESTTPRASIIDDQVGKSPIPQQELTNDDSAQRFWPQQQLREKTTHQLPNNHATSSGNKGIIQRRWLNMKNINKNMEYKPFVNYHQHPSIIAVPPLRPLNPPPVQVASNPPLPPGQLSFRNIAYKPVYDANSARRVSDVATAATTATTATFASAGSHSCSFNTSPVMINQTVSNEDDPDHVGSNENNGASANNSIQYYDNMGPSQVQGSGGGSSSTSRNGGPLSQIYNEHRNLAGFYRPVLQQQLVAKQPLTAAAATTATAANTHYDSTTHAPPINNKKKPRTTPARLPKHITNYLKEWMNTHIDYPYPSEKEKEMLMYDTGIDRKRLDIWLRNNRNRYVKVKRKQQSSQLYH